MANMQCSMLRAGLQHLLTIVDAYERNQSTENRVELMHVQTVIDRWLQDHDVNPELMQHWWQSNTAAKLTPKRSEIKKRKHSPLKAAIDKIAEEQRKEETVETETPITAQEPVEAVA